MPDLQIAFIDAGHTYLRELKDLSEKFEEAIPLHDALKELYEILTRALESDPARSASARDHKRGLYREGPEIHRQNQ